MLKPKQLFIIIYVNFARNAFILTNNNNKQTITPCSVTEKFRKVNFLPLDRVCDDRITFDH